MIDELVAKTWSKKQYYRLSGQASGNEHPSINTIASRYTGKKILEVGCGEGTKLQKIHATHKTGVDISATAIAQAKHKIDRAIIADAENLPFPDKTYDAVLSLFSLEHFQHPRAVLREIARVLKPGGELVILTPNFGAPNRASPCFTGHRAGKLLKGFLTDFCPLNSKVLNWQSVIPRSLTEDYQSDYDTLVEPYGLSLVRFLKNQKFVVKVYSTNWQMEEKGASSLQRIFRALAVLRIFPFIHWGPHLFVIAQKTV